MATFSPTSISIDDTSTSITWTDIETTFSFTEYFLFINEIQVATSLGDDTSNINFSSINLSGYGFVEGNYSVKVTGTGYNVTAVTPITITCFVKGTKILTLNNNI